MKVISEHISHLAEGPLWDKEQQSLYWTDILNGQIWKYNSLDKKTLLIFEGPFHIGGFALTENGGIILCTSKGVFLLPDKNVGDKNSLKEIYQIPMAADERFNDITTDPQGRVYAGTLTRRDKAGTLYRLEKGKTPKAILSGVSISNGMTFSLDEKYFYHTDSPHFTITRYRYHKETGNIDQPEIYFKGNAELGCPDGITLDKEDHIWVAFWGASCIRRLDMNGKIVEEIKIPAIQASSVGFGGDNFQKLYITSACEGGEDLVKGLDQSGNFLGGSVYEINTNVQGREEWFANF